jgi:hypothetical protein
MRFVHILGSCCGAVAIASLGCGAETQVGVGSEPESDSIVEPIIAGDGVTTDLIGTYSFNNTGNEHGYEYCTATLLRDRWLITAYHCVSIGGDLDSPAADPALMTASMGFSIATGLEVHTPASVTPPYDVALVKLDSSLPLPFGHKVPFENPLYRGSSTNLDGKSYHCQGWGNFTCEGGNMGLRSAVLEADVTGLDFTMRPNARGQILTAGDSGASCFDFVNGRYQILSVHHGRGTGNCGELAVETGAYAFRDWVDSVIDRVAVVDASNSTLRIKEGGLGHAWNVTYTNVVAASMSGPRIAALGSDGHCRIQEGDFSNQWVDMWTSGGVTQCLVAGDRVAIRTSDGTFRAKEGSLNGSWTTLASNVAEGVLTGNRVGVRINNTFQVKEGALNASWVVQRTDASQGVLYGNRIGVVTTSGTLYVKAGSLNAPFFNLRSNVQQAALSEDRVGALSAGHFYVLEGPLNGTWVDVHSNVVQGTLSGKRIGLVVNYNPGGTPQYRYLVQEGAVSGGALFLLTAARSVPYQAVPLVKVSQSTGTGAKACTGICNNPTTITLPYSSSGLGTAPVCLETVAPLQGGNCSQFVSPRTLQVNQQTMTCNGANWTSLPPQRGPGHCITATSGNPTARVTLW